MTKNKKRTIAIIEDDIALQLMYKMKLEFEGFIVKTADNGEEGLRLLETSRPDLVLLDLRMPIMNGDEVLAQLRTAEWGSGIRVIVLTNISRTEAPRRLQFLNVERYIVKAHSTPGEVVKIVREILGVEATVDKT